MTIDAHPPNPVDTETPAASPPGALTSGPMPPVRELYHYIAAHQLAGYTPPKDLAMEPETEQVLVATVLADLALERDITAEQILAWCADNPAPIETAPPAPAAAPAGAPVPSPSPPSPPPPSPPPPAGATVLEGRLRVASDLRRISVGLIMFSAVVRGNVRWAARHAVAAGVLRVEKGVESAVARSTAAFNERVIDPVAGRVMAFACHLDGTTPPANITREAVLMAVYGTDRAQWPIWMRWES